jgi:hypothetical protein
MMNLKFSVIIVSLALGLFSCSRNAGNLENLQPETNFRQSVQNLELKSNALSGKGTLKLHMKGTDNSEFIAAGGKLTTIQLVQKGNAQHDIRQKRVTVWDSVEYFDDLLNMETGIMSDLALLNIPAGIYHYAIVQVSDGWVLKNDGKKYPVIFPNNKMVLYFKPFVKIGEKLSPDALFLIDVSHSFVSTKKGTSYIFKPVVKAANLSYAGSLAGGVVNGLTGNPIGNAHIYVDANGERFETLSVDQYFVDDYGIEHYPGEYWIPGIPAGSYTAYAEKEGYQSASAEVSILEGNFHFQNFVLIPQ